MAANINSASSSEKKSMDGRRVVRKCNKVGCNRRVSSEMYDAHSLCSKCRGINCASGIRCSECQEWSDDYYDQYLQRMQRLEDNRLSKLRRRRMMEQLSANCGPFVPPTIANAPLASVAHIIPSSPNPSFSPDDQRWSQNSPISTSGMVSDGTEQAIGVGNDILQVFPLSSLEPEIILSQKDSFFNSDSMSNSEIINNVNNVNINSQVAQVDISTSVEASNMDTNCSSVLPQVAGVTL